VLRHACGTVSCPEQLAIDKVCRIGFWRERAGSHREFINQPTLRGVVLQKNIFTPSLHPRSLKANRQNEPKFASGVGHSFLGCRLKPLMEEVKLRSGCAASADGCPGEKPVLHYFRQHLGQRPCGPSLARFREGACAQLCGGAHVVHESPEIELFRGAERLCSSSRAHRISARWACAPKGQGCWRIRK
jgi:hypothetical protein